MVPDTPFVRCIIASGHRVPSVLLYTDRQLKEIKTYCYAGPNGSVLGFDKTYNLGSIFVTLESTKT